MFDSDLSLREVLGLTDHAAQEAWLALRGEPGLPKSRFGLSSARLFTPRLAASTWRGRRLLGRRIPIITLFNRTPTPVEQGWSVRVTQVRDFRGARLTYDSHNGTDFAVPPGTTVVAAAPGRVVARRSEYNRGGLKIYVDHGRGLMTSYHHLARALVDVGDVVARGQPVALSGYSGIDALASLGAVAPHVHFNVYRGGVVVNPFAAEGAADGAGEVSLWRGTENRPLPARSGRRGDDARRDHNDGAHNDRADEAGAGPTEFDDAAVGALLAALQPRERREALATIDDVALQAWALTIEACTYPTRFAAPDAARALFAGVDVERAPRLTLPFAGVDFDGVVFADDAGFR